MNKRLYVPIDYLDEITPEGRDHPDQWIVSLDEGCRLAHYEEDVAGRALQNGEVVDFSWLERYGDAILEINPDRTWDVSFEMPQGATLCGIDGDIDTISDSVATSVESYFYGLEVGYHTIQYYDWPSSKWKFNAAKKAFFEVAE